MEDGIAKHCNLHEKGKADNSCLLVRQMFRELSGQFQGLDDVAALMLLCYISPKRGRGGARRHLLLEGAAGTAKTELTKVLAKVLCRYGKGTKDDAGYQRVQGMPDLLPSSFLGYEARKPDGSFAFIDGGLLSKCYVFHVDEVNRIPPRTLSVLLESMAEEQVSLTSLLVEEDERLRRLPWLFVVGTQNPGSFIGTGQLPEPLLDRFMARAVMPYPDEVNLVQLLHSLDDTSGRDKPKEKLDLDQVRDATSRYIAKVDGQDRGRAVIEEITAILLASWPLEAASAIPNLQRQLPVNKNLREMVDNSLKYGLGVRAGQALRDLACAAAWCRQGGSEKGEAEWADVVAVAPYVLCHRIQFKPKVYETPDDQSEFVRQFLKQVAQCRVQVKEEREKRSTQ